jgi:hypothetical protein
LPAIGGRRGRLGKIGASDSMQPYSVLNSLFEQRRVFRRHPGACLYEVTPGILTISRPLLRPLSLTQRLALAEAFEVIADPGPDHCTHSNYQDI